MHNKEVDIHNYTIKKVFQNYWRRIRNYRLAFFIAFISSLLNAFLSVIGPGKLEKLIDYISDNKDGNIDMSFVLYLGIRLSVIYGLALLFNVANYLIFTYLIQKLMKKIRGDIFQKMKTIPIESLFSDKKGSIISLITTNLNSINDNLNQSVINIFASIILFIGTLIAMFTSNWIMAIVVVLTTVLGFIGILLIANISDKYYNEQQVNIGEMNGYIEESISSYVIISAYGSAEKSKSKFKQICNNLFDNYFKALFISDLMIPLFGFITNFSYVAVALVGIFLMIKGSISIGVLTAFIVYTQLFSSAVSEISAVMPTFQAIVSASKRIFSFLDLEEEEDEKEKEDLPDNIMGNILFDQVYFGYPDTDKYVIKDFSLNIKSGQKVAIVGETGAGKTTIINLLLRFYEPSKGRITIDGIPISSVKRESVRQNISVVLQNNWLFNGTIRENIAFSSDDSNDERILSICRKIGIEAYILGLPNGLDTFIDNNIPMSQGEIQLITIARALMRNTSIIILDEATSCIDTRKEQVIQNALDKLFEGKTSFIIAHRLSTIKNADIILVMKDGEVAEIGTHDSLIGMNGVYSKLYYSQFNNQK